MTDTFRFEIVMPAASMLSQLGELVIVPGGAGNFGVLPGHAPLRSTLRPGTIEIRNKKLKVLDQVFVEGGFAEVTPERCTILAEEAMPVRDISREEAEIKLKHAHDSFMVAEEFRGALDRQEAEHEVQAAVAMAEAVEAYEKDTQLEEAVEACRAALQNRVREREPLDWAMAQTNLGNALARLQRLEEAVAAFSAALQEQTSERVPLDWAMTQTNLGNALARLQRLEEAVKAYESALSSGAFAAALTSYYVSGVRDNLERARGWLAKRKGS